MPGRKDRNSICEVGQQDAGRSPAPPGPAHAVGHRDQCIVRSRAKDGGAILVGGPSQGMGPGENGGISMGEGNEERHAQVSLQQERRSAWLVGGWTGCTHAISLVESPPADLAECPVEGVRITEATTRGDFESLANEGDEFGMDLAA